MFDVLFSPAAHVGPGSLKRLDDVGPPGSALLVVLDRAVSDAPAVVGQLDALRDRVAAAFSVKRLLNRTPKPVTPADIQAICEELL